MTKKTFYIGAPLALAGAVLIGSTLTLTTNADSATQPGTADDPVVTKSYVDAQIKAALNGGTGTGGSADLGYAIIQLQPGQTMMAKNGTEIVVRSDAKVTAVSLDTNTIPDMTSGNEYAAGSVLPKNHLFVFPNETRGIKAVPSNTAATWVMVRGGYVIKDAAGSVVSQK